MDNVSWFRLYTIGLYKKKNTTNGQSIRHSSIYIDNPKVTFFGGEESVITESALNMSS